MFTCKNWTTWLKWCVSCLWFRRRKSFLKWTKMRYYHEILQLILSQAPESEHVWSVVTEVLQSLNTLAELLIEKYDLIQISNTWCCNRGNIRELKEPGGGSLSAPCRQTVQPLAAHGCLFVGFIKVRKISGLLLSVFQAEEQRGRVAFH